MTPLLLRHVAAAAIGATTGLAAWTTRSRFDVVSTDDGPIRLAMLPSAPEAIALVVGGAVLAMAAAHLVRRRAPGTATCDPGLDTLAPLLVTALLPLPYLPDLADSWPLLTVLAGPAKYVVWAIALVLVADAVISQLRTTGLTRADTPGLGRRRTSKARTALGIVLVSATVFSAAASRLIGTVFPGGDEPHYLVMAQSLWRDGDLRIEDNHQRGDTFEYFPHPLRPHYLKRGVDGEIYSVHPVGLPVLLAPVYAAFGYRGVVALLIAMAALAALIAWTVAVRITGAPAAATLAWAGVALSAPYIFNSFTVYPEIPAALVTVLALALSTGAIGRDRRWRWLGCGLALASLPWLSSKYVPMAGALGLVCLARAWWPGHEDPAEPGSSVGTPLLVRARAVLAIAVPPALSLVGWLAFFWVFWGRWSPAAPYGGASGTEPRHLWRGAPGLLFDQEYGIAIAAPVLVLALVGLMAMARTRDARRLAAELGVVALGLWATVGAFHIWWGGSAAIGRPVIAVLPLLTVPLAWWARRALTHVALRSVFLTLLVAGAANVVVLATQSHGLLLAAGRDGTADWLAWWSPWWALTRAAPTFIADTPAVAMTMVGVWLGPAALVLFVMARREAWPRPGLASLVSSLALISATAVSATLADRVLEADIRPAPRLDQRPSVPLLGSYSPERRPIAARLTSFERVSPEGLLSLITLRARPGENRPAPPVALLHNARWSLPVGRYEVTLSVPDAPGEPVRGDVGLQFGRLGPPVETWPVTMASGSPAVRVFDLPASLGTVGLRGSPEIVAGDVTISLRPLAVIDASVRPEPSLDVVQAHKYPAGWLLMHSSDLEPEAHGFWTRPLRRTVFSLVATGPTPPRLIVRAGGVATGVTVSIDSRAERWQLAAGEARELPLRQRPDGIWLIDLEADTPFVPAEVEPGNTDTRRLGCFVDLSGTP